MSIRVLIADDHRLFRDGLRALLSRQRDFEVVGEVGDGRTAVEAASQEAPDVVLMDLALPGLNGLDATAAIRALDAPPRVVAVSFHEELAWVQRAFRAGADGYVVKTAAFSELGHAIREVARGVRFVSQQLAESLGLRGAPPDVEGGRASAPEPAETASLFDKLTRREREVLHLVVDGLTSRAIGEALGISPRTVDVHRKHIMDKLQVPSVAALVRLAIRGGLIVA